MSITVAAAY